jgi:hypothetical protein
MTCICFSQNNNNISLKPDTVLVDGTGVVHHFCWRVTDQVPAIAKHIVKSRYADTLELHVDSLVRVLDFTILLNNVVIELQTEQIENYKTITRDYKAQSLNQAKYIQKTTRKKNFRRSVSGVLLGVCMAFVSLELVR